MDPKIGQLQHSKSLQILFPMAPEGVLVGNGEAVGTRVTAGALVLTTKQKSQV
jgi:hypothetical protein